MEGEKILRSVSNEGYDITHPSGFLKPSNIHIYVIAQARWPPAESPVTMICLGFIPSYGKA